MTTSCAGMGHFARLFPLIRGVDNKMNHTDLAWQGLLSISNANRQGQRAKATILTDFAPEPYPSAFLKVRSQPLWNL